MDVVQFMILFATVFGFLWTARSDRREIAASMERFRELWAMEAKDFHARLSVMESKKNKDKG